MRLSLDSMRLARRVPTMRRSGWPSNSVNSAVHDTCAWMAGRGSAKGRQGGTGGWGTHRSLVRLQQVQKMRVGAPQARQAVEDGVARAPNAVPPEVVEALGDHEQRHLALGEEVAGAGDVGLGRVSVSRPGAKAVRVGGKRRRCSQATHSLQKTKRLGASAWSALRRRMNSK